MMVQALQSLPVKLVLCLCHTTNTPEGLFDYFNDLDDLTASIDVLDHEDGEFEEIQNAHALSPVFLQSIANNHLAIHQLRQMGCTLPLFNALDERPFTPEEQAEMLNYL